MPTNRADTASRIARTSETEVNDGSVRRISRALRLVSRVPRDGLPHEIHRVRAPFLRGATRPSSRHALFAIEPSWDDAKNPSTARRFAADSERRLTVGKGWTETSAPRSRARDSKLPRGKPNERKETPRRYGAAVRPRGSAQGTLSAVGSPSLAGRSPLAGPHTKSAAARLPPGFLFCPGRYSRGARGNSYLGPEDGSWSFTHASTLSTLRRTSSASRCVNPRDSYSTRFFASNTCDI